MSVSVSKNVASEISDDINSKIAEKEDVIREKVEQTLMNEDESTLRSIMSDINGVNPDDFDDVSAFRDELDAEVTDFVTELYKNTDTNTIQNKLKELEVKLSQETTEDVEIKSKSELERFVKDNRAEHILVAPSDELAFLASVGLFTGFFLIYGIVNVVYKLTGDGPFAWFIGGAVVATVVSAVGGTIAVKKVIPKLKNLYQSLT